MKTIFRCLKRRHSFLVLTVLLAILAGVAPGAPVRGAGTDVSCDVDALITALAAANQSGLDQTINLAPGCVYAFPGDSVLPEITGTVTVNGNNATIVPYRSSPSWHIATSGVLHLTNVTIRDKYHSGPGGALFNEGVLEVDGCTFTANIATAAYDENSGSGGAIYNKGTLAVSGSAFDHNQSRWSGGAIVNDGGIVSITGSTFDANNAFLGGGGALRNRIGGMMTVRDSWFSGNSSGGAGAISNDGSLEVSSSTIAANQGPTGGGLTNTGIATLSDTILRSNQAIQADGGAISNTGTLSLRACIVGGEHAEDGNQAANHGGGIYNVGTLDISNSLISNNSARWHGGGILNMGDLQISTSTLSENRANGVDDNGNAIGFGGALNNSLGRAAISACTFSGNHASSTGAAIHNLTEMSIVNSTISSNRAERIAGGISNSGPLTIESSTIALNSSGYGPGGILNYIGTMSIARSIIANNWDASNPPTMRGNCSLPEVTSGGYNIDSDGTCGLAGVGDLSGVDPLLGPLAVNGGATQTHAPSAPSPAIERVPADQCAVVVDQTGTGRPQGPGCDAGAFEYPTIKKLLSQAARTTVTYNRRDNRTAGGVVTIVETYKNVAGTALHGVFFRATTLQALQSMLGLPAVPTLLNADGGAGGFTVSVPGEIAPTATFRVQYEVGLPRPIWGIFLLLWRDVPYGIPPAAVGAASVAADASSDSYVFETTEYLSADSADEGGDSDHLHLPFVAR